jgi:hypothetical protein
LSVRYNAFRNLLYPPRMIHFGGALPEPRLRRPAVSASYLAILAAAFMFLLPAAAGAAELVVRCTDGAGGAVRLERAELLTYGWGYADAVELGTEGNTLTGPRSLLLLDDDGRPVSGAEVTSYMYWSSSNHCARLSGARLLGTAVSDADGVVEVPDGDFEYAFEIAASDMGLVLSDPELPEYPERLVTTLRGEETVVNLHRRKSVTLTMRVLKSGVPVAGQMLYGCMADCPGGVCASCCGPLSASGPYGIITIPGFYPESYKSIYITDDSGENLFEADPGKLSLERPIEVDLAVCARQGSGI